MKIIGNGTKLDSSKLKILFCFVHQLLSKKEGSCWAWNDLKVKVFNFNSPYLSLHKWWMEQHPDEDETQSMYYNAVYNFDNNIMYKGRAYRGSVSNCDSYADITLHFNLKCGLHEFAQLFAHELLHTYGYTDIYGDDDNYLGDENGIILYNEEPLSEDQMNLVMEKFGDVDFTEQPKPKKPKQDIVLKRYNNFQSKFNTWNKKLKLAQTKVEKYQSEIKKYEKKYSERINSNK